VLWYAKENGAPARVHAFGTGQESGLTDNFTTTLQWNDGSVAVLSQCLSGFEHHTLLEVGGESGSVRTWWSGARDRTLHPEFELKVQRAGGEPDTVAIPKSGEVFELEENLRAALQGFRAGRSILSPEEARASIAVCLAAEQSFREGKAIELELGRPR
jgi:myo-inositol 2-dehydrogenase/D-chiro-inositol 1-dehydrogenase